MATKRLQVDLPVCPFPGCDRVGKLPTEGSRKDFCTGGVERSHRKTRMEARRFVEVRSGGRLGE